jgi:hypothetical protein
MSYLADYTLAMDYVRERFGMSPSVSLYELVVKLVSEFKRIEVELQKSQKGKSCQTKQKKSKTTQFKSAK